MLSDIFGIIVGGAVAFFVGLAVATWMKKRRNR